MTRYSSRPLSYFSWRFAVVHRDARLCAAANAAEPPPAAAPPRHLLTTTTRSFGRSSLTSSRSTCRRRCRCRSTRMNFHLTHRFNEDLRNDSFGDAAGQPVRSRQRRQHRPRIPLRRDEAPRSDRAADQPQQDLPVHGEIRRLASDRVMPCRVVGDRVDRRRQQLPQHRRRRAGELRAGARRRRVADDRAIALALYATPMWVHNTGTGSGDDARHRLHRARRPRARLAQHVFRARGCRRASAAWRSATREYRVRDREARRRARVLADVQQRRRHDVPPDRAWRRAGTSQSRVQPDPEILLIMSAKKELVR